MFDLLRIATALTPIALYAIVLGLMRTRSTPTVLSGAMDIMLLGFALSGMIFVGPIELFFPRGAYSILGVWTWVLLIVLFLFTLLLIAMSVPPKMIVYGLGREELARELNELFEENEIQAQWAGSVVILPELGIQACCETAGFGNSIAHLVATGRKQDPISWYNLERQLVMRLEKTTNQGKRTAFSWLFAGVAILFVVAAFVYTDIDRLTTIVQSTFE